MRRPLPGLSFIALMTKLLVFVMPGLVPGIHVLAASRKDVDGRDKPGHDGREYPQNNPTIRPSAPTSIWSAAGTLGRPGMVMISPQIATMNSAPADSRASRTVMT